MVRQIRPGPWACHDKNTQLCKCRIVFSVVKKDPKHAHWLVRERFWNGYAAVWVRTAAVAYKLNWTHVLGGNLLRTSGDKCGRKNVNSFNAVPSRIR